jgi:hypothetical protein
VAAPASEECRADAGQRGCKKSVLCYSVFVSRRKLPVQTTSIEEHRLKGKRKGALLKEQVWFEDGKVVGYALAYINLKRCPADNGRVLGYDHSHGYHHRHWMGTVQAFNFTSFEGLAERFYNEVQELWRIEDGED